MSTSGDRGEMSTNVGVPSPGTRDVGLSGDSLPPLAKRMLNALRREGEMSEYELVVRLRPAYPEAVRSVARQLRQAGLIERDDEEKVIRLVW
jgi:hypothetical protein